MRTLLSNFEKKSYSQEGEDILFERIFHKKASGVYVDIGAHHPKRFSNTYWAYKRGWVGICLDPMPGGKKKFLRTRPKDIFIEVGVGINKGKSTYFKFSDAALNTFSDQRAQLLTTTTEYKLLSKESVYIDTLENILDAYLPKDINSKIDFMSIDVEGSELSVLKSNNFIKYAPTIIVVEIINLDINNLSKNLIVKYLLKHNYKINSILYHSVFFY